MLINRWLDKEDVACTHTHTHTHTHTRILFSHEKNEIMLFAATWLELKGIMPGEMSKKDK